MSEMYPIANRASSRRLFLGAATAAGALRVAGAQDRIRVGVIGTGPRGQYLMKQLQKIGGVEFPAVCDVYDVRRAQAAEIAGGRAEGYGDHRAVVERADLDAVIVATPDHWHAPITIDALRAGKDVYVEKPMVHKPEDGLAIIRAARAGKRIVQVGMQGRGLPQFLEPKRRYIDTGIIGKVGLVRTWYTSNQGYIQAPPSGMDRKPDGLDWDRWLGPAPWRPYHSSYVRGGWRNFYDFHGGGILEWGAHTVVLCHWAADLDDTQPVEYEPVGTNVGPYFVNCRYENGVKLVMRDNGWNGALNTGSCSFRIEGDKGWVETGDQTRIECSDNIKPLLRPTEPASLALENHVKEFVRCIRERRTPSANAAAAANSHVTCHAAFIAFQLGKTLTWDPATRAFTNSDVANNMRTRALREPWRI